MRNTLSAAFCDDDPVFRSLLRETAGAALLENGIIIDAFEAGSGEDLAAVLEHRSFELIFLDIDMPGLDGVRLGQQLRDRGCGADIIYVSNLDERVFEIFSVHPWSFVRKRRFARELPAVLAEYARARERLTGTLLLTGAEGQTLSVAPSDIVYAEAAGKTQKLSLVSVGEPVPVRLALRDLEAQLLPHGFIRIHKGFLVNYRYIKKITSRSVLMDTGETLPVGRDRLGPARERYLELMRWRGRP